MPYTNSFRLILAFGSNLGDRNKNFETALQKLSKSDASLVFIRQSRCLLNSPFQSALYNVKDQEDYSNFICEIKTLKNPYDFYKDIIVPIEDALGHSRTEKWAPRVLDIDILLGAVNNELNFENCSPVIINSKLFTLPHAGLLDPERKILLQMLFNELNLGYENIQCHFTHKSRTTLFGIEHVNRV